MQETIGILEGHSRGQRVQATGKGAEGDPRGADRRGRGQGDGKWDLGGVNNRHGGAKGAGREAEGREVFCRDGGKKYNWHTHFRHI